MPLTFEFEHASALYDAAIEAFAAHGYDKASINRILTAAGMSKGQFYYHFGNKQGLYLAIAGEVIARRDAFLAKTDDGEAPDLFTWLRQRAGLIARMNAADPSIMQFTESFVRERGKPIFDATMTAHGPSGASALQVAVQRALDRGQIRTDLPAPFVHGLVAGLFQNVTELASLDGAEDLAANLEHFYTFVQDGLAPRESSP